MLERINELFGVEPDNPMRRASIAVLVGALGTVMILLVILYNLNLQGNELIKNSADIKAQVEALQQITIILIVLFVSMLGSLIYYVILPWNKKTIQET